MTGFEGIALTKEIVGVITAIGIVPTLIIVSICFFFVFRELKKQITILEQALDAQKKYTIEQDTKMFELIKQHDDDIKFIERNYIEKEQHYRDFEGWKSEIQKVSTLIIDLYKITNNGGKNE